MRKIPNLTVLLSAALLFIVILLIGLGGNPAAAGVLQRDRAPQIEIEPALENRLMAGEGDFTYLIYFREQPDLSPALEMEWEARGRYVVEKLQGAAQDSQKAVRDYLDTRGVRYQSFWVDNVIVVQGGSSVATFDGLLRFPEIEALRARRRMMVHESTPAREVNAEIQVVENNLLHVGADQVWAMGYTGTGITVANIDTGVNYTHDALVNQYRGNLGGSFDHNYNWWDPSPGGSNLFPIDENLYSHGTHTMGIMVGDDGGSNQIGMAPGAQWIACRAFEAFNQTFAAGDDVELLECGQFMLAPWDLQGSNPDPDLRPHIVNNSWGDCLQFLDTWYKGVIASWRAAGIYPVFSNGNAGNCDYPTPPGLNTVANPARYGDVTGVGATLRDSSIYYPSSNWGPTDDLDTINPLDYPTIKPQVVAPGAGIRSSVGDDDVYSQLTGTSMAAPHVAGLVALMWQAAPCLVGDYAATETILMLTATPIPYETDNGDEGPNNVPNHATGWGEINALAAVQAALASCPIHTTPRSQQICAPGEAVYQVAVNETLSEPVDLSVSGDPSGVTSMIVPDTVIPPGTSTLTTSISTSAMAGDYALQVQGNSGEGIFTDTIHLGVRTDLPAQPVLLSPLDGAEGVHEKPLLVWDPGLQADTYLLEIALDPDFSTLVYTTTVSTTSFQGSEWLAFNRLYYWRVTPGNLCGMGPASQVFNFTTRSTPAILLVDDDDNGPDVQGFFTQTLESMGIAYSLWDNQPLGQEPGTAFLSNFRAVIWFTGDNYNLWTGPGPTGEQALSTWLDRGGCLLFTSQDYVKVQGVSDLMKNYLGVSSVKQEVDYTIVTGAGPVFSELGSYTLIYPYENSSDSPTPAIGVDMAFTSFSNTAGVSWENGNFKTSYWGFPFEALPNLASRQAAAKAFLDWCKIYHHYLPLVVR